MIENTAKKMLISDGNFNFSTIIFMIECFVGNLGRNNSSLITILSGNRFPAKI